MTFQERAVSPPRPVELFVDGRWQRGQLMAWQLSKRGVRARVRHITGVGPELKEPRWVNADLVRPRRLHREAWFAPFVSQPLDG